jgi:hypothetical protein
MRGNLVTRTSVTRLTGRGSGELNAMTCDDATLSVAYVFPAGRA